MKIGILGMGAVGCAIYHELHEYKDLYILVDQKRKERYEENGFMINGTVYYPNCCLNGTMDLIIICVKNYQLKDALDLAKNFMDKNTILLPMLNGITAREDILKVYPNQLVLYGVINVEANKDGNGVHTSPILNFQYGDADNTNPSKYVLDIHSILKAYKVRHQIYPHMIRRVWMKWMMNMGINQISALCNATYKDMLHPLLQDLLHDIFYEVYEVSKAYDVGLTQEDLDETIQKCRDFSSSRVTSLTLDFNQKGENELSCFSETLIRLARDKNISVPINMTLYRLLKSLDENNKKGR